MAISKNYNPVEIEDKWYEQWMKAEVFKSVPDEREPYTITIPPPNVTGILHMGHMLNNTIQDVLIRRKRMQGYNACWVPGTDHASIATEAKVVDMLRKKGVKKSDLSREEFLKHAFQWKEKYGGIILKQLRKLGASCDWERTSFTMDPEYSESVINVFCELYERGYIYRGLRMVNWDPQALTAVSDEEVYHKEVDGHLYYVRYRIEGTENEYITIATTRPETILGDTAIAVHPDDERYKHLHGKNALVPLINRSIPIITDDYLDMEFGTGCLKVTPAHDPNDYEIGKRHKIETIDTLNANGTLNEAAGLYVGMDRFAVRKQIAKDLKAQGNLVKMESYRHSVGFSERTHAVIEPRLSLQWFLRMKGISQKARDAVMDDIVKLFPPKFKNTYRHWMDNVRDWCLSRQLWWGHQIPAYYIKGTDQFVVAPSAELALEKARALTGNAELSADELIQDPDVLDTWASSWLWPISVFNGLTRPDNADIAYYYPTNDLVTAPEILFFWVARMIIAGYEFMGERPFNNVYLTGIVRDKQRRKMSKSLGNSPDPLELIQKYGADGVRVGMMLCSPAGNDLLYDNSLVEQGTRFANKIWNAFRLISGWEVADQEPTAIDKVAIEWMRERAEAVAAEIEDHFEKFRLSDALMSLYKLIWDDFCSWFLEMIKPAYGSPISKTTLNAALDVFESLLQLLHPYMPFITEDIWQNLRAREEGVFITTSQLPKAKGSEAAILVEMELIQETITAGRNFRVKKGLKQKEAISLFIKTDSAELFQRYQDILHKFLNTAEISFVDKQVEGAGSLRVRTHELYIPLENVDVEAEKAKILKEISYTEGFLSKVMKKLGNERFVSRAPEKVVALERKKQADAEAKLSLLKESLAKLG